MNYSEIFMHFSPQGAEHCYEMSGLPEPKNAVNEIVIGVSGEWQLHLVLRG